MLHCHAQRRRGFFAFVCIFDFQRCYSTDGGDRGKEEERAEGEKMKKKEGKKKTEKKKKRKKKKGGMYVCCWGICESPDPSL